MKKFFTAVLTLSFVLLFCVTASAQYQFQFTGGGSFFGEEGALGSYNATLLDFTFPGGGARAAGMGGAQIGLAEGEMAFSWNPANMISIDKTKFGIQFLSQADKNTNVAISTFYEVYPEASVQEYELNRENTRLNYGGFVSPFTLMDRDWAVGGGYRGFIDLESDYNSPGYVSENNRFQQSKAVDAISLGLAGRLTEQVGFGFTLNTYVRGTESELYLANFFEFEDVQTGDTIYVSTALKNRATFSGFNADIGLSGDFGMFKVGVVVHTPLALKYKNTYTELYYVPNGPIGNIFRQTYQYNIPFSYSAGFAVTPVENFTFAFDFDQKPMSNLDIDVDWEIAVNGDTLFGNINDRTVDPEWNDLNQFRIGMEYMFDAGFADLPIRAGYRNQPSILSEITKISDVNGYSYGDQITTPIMTFGTGAYFEKIWVDLAYQFGSSSYDREIEYDGATETFEIKTDYSKIFFSVGMYF